MKRPDDLKVGDRFVVKHHEYINTGEVVTLERDGGSKMPLFGYSGRLYWIDFDQLEPYVEPKLYDSRIFEVDVALTKPFNKGDNMTDLTKYQPDTDRLDNGKVYEFSNDGENWFKELLVNSSAIGDQIYEGTTNYWRYVREMSADSLGKIAPEPLVEGQAYVFDVGSDTGLFGVFNGGRLCTADLDDPVASIIRFDLDRCTNIRKLVPEK